MKYDADSGQVKAFVEAFQRVKGWNYPLTTTTKRAYIRVDRDHSGVFLICRKTGKVYNVKGYGTRGTQAGNIYNLTAAYTHTERLAVVK